MCCRFIKKIDIYWSSFFCIILHIKWLRKSLKTKLFSISGWNERLSNHRSCIKRMRRELAEDCIKCLKHRVDPVTFSAADSTVFFFFATTQIYIKCESPGKNTAKLPSRPHKVFVEIFNLRIEYYYGGCCDVGGKVFGEISRRFYSGGGRFWWIYFINILKLLLLHPLWNCGFLFFIRLNSKNYFCDDPSKSGNRRKV